MKKIAVIYGNCHFVNIYNHLQCSKLFTDLYDIHLINLHAYLVYEYKDRTDFIDEHRVLFEKADVLICQFVRTDRNFITHTNIIKDHVKKNCIVIKIPHYTFSGYHPPINISDVNFSLSDTKEKILKAFDQHIHKEATISHYEESLKELERLDLTSDIKMYPYVKDNGKKYRLFNSRSYPTSLFFYQCTLKILDFLQLKESQLSFYDNQFAHNVRFPILPLIKQFLNLEFEILFDEYQKIIYHISDYLRVCKKHNVNNINLDKDLDLFMELQQLTKQNL
jgi:hypothetical protein